MQAAAAAGYPSGAPGFLPMASHPAITGGPSMGWPAPIHTRPPPAFHPSMSPMDAYTPADAPLAEMRPPPVPMPAKVAAPPENKIFQAVYSNVPVYELKVGDTGIMRRRADSWFNATQILKCANVAKAARTRILEKDIMCAEPYEKVQGGYGRYQGTWIPMHRAKQLAEDHGVAEALQPIFDYQPASAEENGDAATPLDTSMSASASKAKEGTPSSTKTASNQDKDYPNTRKRTSSTSTTGRDTPAKRLRVDTSGTPRLNGAAPNIVPTNGPISSLLPVPTPPESIPRQLNEALPPSKPNGDVVDGSTADHHRKLLMSLFMDASPLLQSSEPDLRQVLPQDIDPDLPIDDQLHAALHWAAALAKINLVKALIAIGANPKRGNHGGETALIRAVLATNNYDTDAFAGVLEALAASLRTTDSLGRTILHHVALVAGVKGRAPSAKYYMETVLEFVAKRQDGDFQTLVDAQDTNGDSALHIAARVGSKALIKMLLEVGAARDRQNKLGLRPIDFGVGTTGSGSPNSSPTTPTATNSAVAPPSTQADEAVRKITETLKELSDMYAEELKAKNTVLDQTRTQLRTATRELAEQRQQIEAVRADLAQRDVHQAHITALEAALASEGRFDTTGRTELSGAPSTDPAFQYSGPNALLPPDLPFDGFDATVEPQLPSATSSNKIEALAQTKRMAAWYRRMLGLLRQRLGSPAGTNTELERAYQRIVSMCCNVSLDQVDVMLPQLLVALESDGESVDLGRVAQVMRTAA